MATVKKSGTADAATTGGPAGTNIEEAEGGELMPLDYLLAIMRDECQPFSFRFKAALAALPYCHRKLAAVEHSEKPGISREEALRQLAAEDEELLKDTRH